MFKMRLISLLLILFTVKLVTPVYSHTTIGNLNGNPPFYRANDHELNPTNSFGAAHVPGPLGYVWPGSGFNLYVGGDHPGYQSPFENFQEPLQVAGNSYSPEGAIMTSTPHQDNVGDLIFAINFSQPRAFITPSNPNPTFKYNNITLYIPAPIVDKHGQLLQDGFEPAGGINWAGGDTSNILTTLTADYGKIFVGKTDLNDPFAPGWWVIRIVPSGGGLVFTPEREWGEWYYIRVNQLRAPDISGRYIFKIFLGDHYPVKGQGSPLINTTMPVENWPVLLVKGEVDPAVIYGTVRYGEGADDALRGKPVKLPGRVRAVGVACDPLTGKPTGRAVEARGYFNASAEGHYEVEGVAPGIYDIYASAAGLPERKVAENIQVYRGQSLNLDIQLDPGPQVRGEVHSKSCHGSIPWRGELPISIAIYDSDNYVEDNVVCQSPINLTHAPYTSYVIGNTVFSSAGLAPPNTPKMVAFPWEGPVTYYPYTNIPPFRDPFGVFNGVGPAQVWWVNPTGSLDPTTGLGSGPSTFRFQFGAQRYYGAPRHFSGMVPQVFGTWIDGLKPGTYFVRAFVNGYVQTDVSGSRFRDYYFTVERQTLSVDLFMDLYISGTLNLTVHFHDKPAGLQTQAVGGPDPGRFLIVEVVDSKGSLAAFNFTYVTAQSRSASITLNGLGMVGVIPPPDPRAGVKYSLYKYRGYRDYGIYPGTYLIHIYMRGYIQALTPEFRLDELDQPLASSISTCGALTSISTSMVRGGGVNVTVYSVDWQDPPTQIQWRWDGASAYILIYDMATRKFIDVVYFWNSAVGSWNLPKTDSDYVTLPYPGWRVSFGSKASMLVTNGSTILERLGPDLPNIPSPYPTQTLASTVFMQSSMRIGFLYNPLSYRSLDFKSSVAIYPGQYAVTGWTYGYVQEGVVRLGDLGKCTVAVGLGQVADSSIKLIKGIEFNISIMFRREGLPVGLPSNMSMRIRIYDDKDMLVAAASTSLDIGMIVDSSEYGFFADGKKIADAGGSKPPIPAGTFKVEYKGLAGLFGYVDPITGTEAVRRMILFSADSGVWGGGAVKIPGVYGGEWQVMVEMVPWYSQTRFHPPPAGMLQGEVHQTKFRTILPYNHLGPFELREIVKIPNVNLGGRASVAVTLDMMGLLTGTVVLYNMHGDPRSVSWATLTIDGPSRQVTYCWDGFYEVYLPQGAYRITVNEPGLKPRNLTIVVPDGGVINMNIQLRSSGLPIPEYKDLTMPLTLTSTILTTKLSLYIMGRKPYKRQENLRMKILERQKRIRMN
ncbi:MAG: carboxypeptidase-like regulatory domain-containing protein [Candidatus Bathyarchaeia archaeon]